MAYKDADKTDRSRTKPKKRKEIDIEKKMKQGLSKIISLSKNMNGNMHVIRDNLIQLAVDCLHIILSANFVHQSNVKIQTINKLLLKIQVLIALIQVADDEKLFNTKDVPKIIMILDEVETQAMKWKNYFTTHEG